MHAAVRSYDSDEIAFDDSRLAPEPASSPQLEVEVSGRSTRRLRRRDEFFGGEEAAAPPPPRRSSRRRKAEDESWRQAMAFAGVPLCPVCRAQNPLSSVFCSRCQHPIRPTPPSSASHRSLPRRFRWHLPVRIAGVLLTGAAVAAAGMVWGRAAVDLLY